MDDCLILWYWEQQSIAASAKPMSCLEKIKFLTGGLRLNTYFLPRKNYRNGGCRAHIFDRERNPTEELTHVKLRCWT